MHTITFPLSVINIKKLGCCLSQQSTIYLTMKRSFFTTVLFLFFCIVNAQTNPENSNFVIGANLVSRHLDGYTYYYPRLLFEYSFLKTSSFETLVEYINHKPTGKRIISYPLSLGYKLNIIPWIIKNKNLTDHLKVYNSLRYTILFSPFDSSFPFSNLQIFHYVRYAPGADFYFNSNLGANFEMVFGQSMRTTFAVGVKYRF